MISGPTKLTYSSDVKVKKVVSGKEMFEAVKKKLPTHIAVCTAAVSDFKPLSIKKNKIKKDSKITEIKIEKNPDILGYLGKNNRYKPKLLVGFAAETEDLIKNSIKKMQEKFCDIIIANDISNKEIGFNSDLNEVTIIDKMVKLKKLKRVQKNLSLHLLLKKL